MPRSDPLSNVFLADEALLAPGGIPIPGDHVHPFPTDRAIAGGLGPQWCATTYATEVATALPSVDGWPAFDLVLVGIGGDGHLLSVFPGSPALTSDRVGLAIPAPTHIEPHVERVTLNPAILGAAGHVLAMAAGEGKAEVVARILEGPRDPAALPGVLARRSTATWLLDVAAAALLHDRTPAEPRVAVVTAAGRSAGARRAGRGTTDRRSGRDRHRLVPLGRRAAHRPGPRASADHTAWRTAGPCWPRATPSTRSIGAGAGQAATRHPYAIAREYEDLAALVDEVAATEGRPVDVVGHSFGGRVGLGAALLTPHLRRLVVYEGAPAPGGRSFHGDAVMAGRLEALAAADDREGLLSYFLATVVGMTPDELAAYRVGPTWPVRVEAAPTIVREMWAEATEDAGPERYAAIRIPVLQIVGGDSSALFTDGTWALDRLLPNGRVVVIPGAKHAAHHSHPERFVQEVRAFLDDVPPPTGATR